MNANAMPTAGQIIPIYANAMPTQKKGCPQLIMYSTYALDRSTPDSGAMRYRKSHGLKSDKSDNSHQRVGMEFGN